MGLYPSCREGDLCPNTNLSFKSNRIERIDREQGFRDTEGESSSTPINKALDSIVLSREAAAWGSAR